MTLPVVFLPEARADLDVAMSITVSVHQAALTEPPTQTTASRTSRGVVLEDL